MPTNEDTRIIHILVVEDDIHIARLIGLTMPSLGTPYRFTNVMSAAEALDLWKRKSFDLLLTDYNIPGMNGIDLVRTLREQKSEVPIIMTTAFATPEVERKALQAGVTSFFAKPFAIDDLIEHIRLLLSDNENNQENATQ